MTTRSMLALLVGGVLPALLFGISGVFQKVCARAGIGTGPYLAITGAVVLAVGGLWTLIERDAALNRVGAACTGLFGLFWALGILGIAVALRRFDGPISQLVPLYNMNTLVAVLIGLVAMGEWRQVQSGRIVLAALLIIAGGILAATSSK